MCYTNAKNELFEQLLKGRVCGCGDVDMAEYSGLQVKYRGVITIFYIHNLSDAGGLEGKEIFKTRKRGDVYFLENIECNSLKDLEGWLDEAKEYFDDQDLYSTYDIDIYNVTPLDLMTMLFEYLAGHQDTVYLARPAAVERWIDGGPWPVIEQRPNDRSFLGDVYEAI